MLVDLDFFDQIAVGEVKGDVTFRHGDAVHLNQLLHLCLKLFRQHGLLLLFAQQLVALDLRFLVLFYRFPGLTRLNA